MMRIKVQNEKMEERQHHAYCVSHKYLMIMYRKRLLGYKRLEKKCKSLHENAFVDIHLPPLFLLL